MNKSFLQRTTLRFKQWSRRSYAAFKSIGRHVTIGSLKSIVSDSLLGKQKNIASIFITAWRDNTEISENDWANPPDEELLLELSYAPVLLQTKSNCGFVKPHYSVINYLWLKVFVYKAFSFFFPLFEGGFRPRQKTGWLSILKL